MSDINRRFVVAIRSFGLGQKSLGKFCAHMEPSPPLHETLYQLIFKKLHSALIGGSRKPMMKASKEVLSPGTRGNGNIRNRGKFGAGAQCFRTYNYS